MCCLRKLLILLVAMVPTAVSPASAQGVSEPRQWCERTLETYMERRGAALYDLLLKETAIGATSAQEMEKMRSRMIADFDSAGVPHSTEFASESDLGPSLKKLRYLIKFRRAPMMVEFTFYRLDKTWDVVNFWYGTGNVVWEKVGTVQ